MCHSKIEEGSITIFATLSVMLIGSLLLTLLEAARFEEFKKVAQIRTEAAAEALFANYNKTLWENYHMLLLDDGPGQEFSMMSREAGLVDLINMGSGSEGENENSLLIADAGLASITDYCLIGDDEGSAFCAAASAYMKNNWAYEAYEIGSELYDAIQEAENSDSEVEFYIEGGQFLFIEETEEDEEEDADSSQENEKIEKSKQANPGITNLNEEREISYTTFGIFNPIKFINAIRENGALALVLPNESSYSTQGFDQSSCMSSREIEVGNGLLSEGDEDLGIMDTGLMEAYLLRYFSSYGNQMDGHYLDYELEYIICGKDSDKDNLKAIVNRLIWIREVLNFAYIITDTTKVADAEVTAGLLSGFLLQPELYEPLKYGILAAWAYAESILDVRALLQGKKVPLYKDSACWTSELSNIGDLLKGNLTAEESESGFGYQAYLFAFLLIEGQKNESYRALDAMELTVRSQDDNTDFCIDHMVLEAKISFSFEYHTAFMDVSELTGGKGQMFCVDAATNYSYRRAGV